MSGRDDAALVGRPVTVMGLGLFGGGAAAARFLAGRGARVTVTDLRSAEVLGPARKELEGLELRYVLGEHRPEDFTDAALVVANPAVPPGNRFLAAARAAGVPVTSEIALFLDRCRGRVAAITGTQGKSSTTSFLAQLLRAAGRPVFLGGNIGISVLDELERIDESALCAVELSSYQLETLPEDWSRERVDSPLVAAVVTNLLSDHLERHGDRERYVRAKLRLLELLRPGGVALLPAGEPLVDAADPPADLRRIDHPGGELRIEAGEFRLGARSLGRVEDAPFRVDFQLHDLLLALGTASLLGAPAEALARALPGLRGLPHRLDPVGRIGGRRLWDNSVSTTPDSTVSALAAVAPGATLVVGGQTKDLDLAPLLRVARERSARVVVFGAARREWPARFAGAGVEVREAAGPAEALEAALDLGDSDILISPACSSFDAYPNFEARAREFLATADRLGLVGAAAEPPQKGREGLSRGIDRAYEGA